MCSNFAIFSILLLHALAHDASPARILGLFAHNGKSHQMVFEPLLRKLAERGHHVTVASFFPLQNPPENYTDVSLQGIVGLGVEDVDLNWYEGNNVLYSMLGIDEMAKQMFDIHPLADIALEVCSKLVSWPPLAEALKKEYDVILLENFNSDCMLGLTHVYRKEAPTISLSTTGLMHWSSDRIGVVDNPSYVPAISADFTSPMDFSQRLKNTILNYYFKYWYRYYVQVKEQEIIEKHFGRKITDLNDLAKNTTMMLANVFHSLNGVKPSLPGLVEVGGMHLNAERTNIPSYIERFLNESVEGVVLFSFGSLIKTSTIPEYKEQMIVKALNRLKQGVIWKYEDSGEEGTRVGNILKVRWIPQYELLRHKKVIAFIGHGGLLGMTEVISVGKPMLVVPFFGDQPYNGAAAKEAGLGIPISYEHLTEESFYDAINTVLSAEMRLSARRASKIWLDRQSNPLDTAVYWVERVIRWGHQDPLLSPARHLSFVQYALIDVAAVLILAVVVIGYVAKLLITLIFKLLKVSFNSKEKAKLH